ncbi:MAG: Redox-sensing transcriptional repressor rex [Thermodesulfobacterium sp. 37_54]|jgi:redox-sensing transcriptional repressor|uniref:Redox-sensing transcriptional repressor Rex n=1 Tax=Thermodesulfobacterium commune TaxID=1741 RepID=A0A117LC21_9BACT|nr:MULTISPECIES: redox-sensing transcriptional repressor Rex [Thermodesulfobacterium]KUJ98338.1 MAG: Redox-sensing transcriptional repressor rex [Thermodesulfobacterium sp. 37_54]KUK19929.1 MAG: Redox-sensing transcriptional repressor rex [Thermodesulfobacterium commune]KUK37703.1 MAG: Redox-sensing transcriptional repressor rex [Thermodesulfobacterium commune]MDN5379869.1 redox-sensing transcriptional repressor [Thermodesulfobacterium sp.]HAA83271.1 redox-sensing transcriptional repressor Rex
MKIKDLPENTLERLIFYLKILENLEDKGIGSLSSEELAELAGVTSAQLRKDLNFLGSLGTKGVGYNVKTLKFNLKKFLGLSQEWNLILGGISPLGIFLLENKELQKEGFYFMAAFDIREEHIGRIYNGISVYNLEQVSYVFKAIKVDIGVITAEENAEVYIKTFLDHGLKAILNLTKIPFFSRNDSVRIENLSFSLGLTKLSYFLSR